MLSLDVRGRIGTFGIDAALDAGMGLTALYGHSGAGKTTLLRALAGLWTPDEGRIAVGDDVLFDSDAGIDVPVEKRRMGIVFQAPLLFPHLDVERNLRYAHRKGADDLWCSVLSILDLSGLLKRRPRHLSGGEAQRVALGRALLSDPRVLLLDEPLTGLDDFRRGQVIPYLAAIRDAMALPIVYVSHHRDEIERLADLVFVVEGGRVTRELTPTELAQFRLGDPAA